MTSDIQSAVEGKKVLQRETSINVIIYNWAVSIIYAIGSGYSYEHNA